MFTNHWLRKIMARNWETIKNQGRAYSNQVKSIIERLKFYTNRLSIIGRLKVF